MDSDRSIMWSWQSQPGHEDFDVDTAASDWSFHRKSMFDPRYTPFYSRPIKMEQPWLDAFAPAMPEASVSGNSLVMSSFEALLNQSGLPKADRTGSRDGTTLLEYIAARRKHNMSPASYVADT